MQRFCGRTLTEIKKKNAGSGVTSPRLVGMFLLLLSTDAVSEEIRLIDHSLHSINDLVQTIAKIHKILIHDYFLGYCWPVLIHLRS